jgi:hypothetical protein
LQVKSKSDGEKLFVLDGTELHAHAVYFLEAHTVLARQLATLGDLMDGAL